MIQTAPSYTEMSKTDLIGIIHTQQTVIQRFYRLLPVQNKVLAPGEKLAWAAAKPLIDNEKPNEQGLVRLPIDKVAEQIGMSESSASRYLMNICERFDATHEVEPYTTKKGQKCNLTYIDPTDLLWTTYPDELPLPPEKERTINGNGKQCPRCHTDNLKITPRRIKYQEIQECECCGYRKVSGILDDNDPLPPSEYIPPKLEETEEAEKGPQAGEPFGEEEKGQTSASLTCSQSPVDAPPDASTEKGLQAEKPFGDTPDLLPELKSRRIWTCWRYEVEEGKEKPTKVPNVADLLGTRKASNTDPSTWRTYDCAVACYEQSQSWDRSETSKRKPFDGIGFMCDGTFTFMDQDHCRDPQTGEITQEAMERARALNSYTEPSVSGDGIHTYAWGNLPAGRRRDSARGIEMYDCARFCVFTGVPLPDFPQTMEKREEQLLALHSQLFPERPGPDIGPLWNDDSPCSLPEEEILEKARSARNGAKFSALFNGEWKGSYGSQSEADQALCNMLAYWCDKSVTTIDGLFRKSGLYREKWERVDYRENTIKRALAIVTQREGGVHKQEIQSGSTVFG